jgi:hypothetical protein
MRRALLAITIAVALIAVGSFAYAGGIAANRTFDLKFVGFCDGMHLTVSYTTGEVTGTSTGCYAGRPVSGWVGAVTGGNYDGLALVVGKDPSETTFGVVFVIGDSPKNWQNKNLTTGAVIHSGTWEIGVPVAGDAGGLSLPSSGQ